jgi:hypothetical protein
VRDGPGRALTPGCAGTKKRHVQCGDAPSNKRFGNCLLGLHCSQKACPGNRAQAGFRPRCSPPTRIAPQFINRRDDKLWITSHRVAHAPRGDRRPSANGLLDARIVSVRVINPPPMPSQSALTHRQGRLSETPSSSGNFLGVSPGGKTRQGSRRRGGFSFAAESPPRGGLRRRAVRGALVRFAPVRSP